MITAQKLQVNIEVSNGYNDKKLIILCCEIIFMTIKNF